MNLYIRIFIYAYIQMYQTMIGTSIDLYCILQFVGFLCTFRFVSPCLTFADRNFLHEVPKSKKTSSTLFQLKEQH